jgi:polar amino acid transport system permease protein
MSQPTQSRQHHADDSAGEPGEGYRTHVIRRPVSWGNIVAGALLLLFLFLVIRTFATSANMRWEVVGEFLFNGRIIDGVRTTIELTVISQVLAIFIGFALAYAWQTKNIVASTASWLYIWIFRGTPLLVQLLFWFNIALLIPTVSINIPLLGSWSWNTNDLISGYTAALLGLAFHEGAYMAEIIRGGFLGVPKGQTEAALSVGMTKGQALRRIVLPQSVRLIIPPTGNQFISLLKMTSLVAVIGGGDLLTRAQFIYGANFAVIPLLIVASIWYLVLVTISTAIQWQIERKLDPARSKKVAVGPRLIDRFLPRSRSLG